MQSINKLKQIARETPYLSKTGQHARHANSSSSSSCLINDKWVSLTSMHTSSRTVKFQYLPSMLVQMLINTAKAQTKDLKRFSQFCMIKGFFLALAKRLT